MPKAKKDKTSKRPGRAGAASATNGLSKAQLTDVVGLMSALRDVQSKRTADSQAIAKSTQKDSNLTEASYKKLKELHQRVVEHSQIEANLIGGISRTLTEVINHMDRQSGRLVNRQSAVAVLNSLDTSLPVWPDSNCPPLCGAIQCDYSFALSPGYQVAACVSKPGEQDIRWILGTIANRENDKYIIHDIIDESTVQEKYILKRDNVIPLPLWMPQPGIPDTYFPKDYQVLALYPQTTCFYPAIVNEPPTKKRATYMLHFDDDDYEDGRVRFQEVPIRFVVSHFSEI